MNDYVNRLCNNCGFTNVRIFQYKGGYITICERCNWCEELDIYFDDWSNLERISM